MAAHAAIALDPLGKPIRTQRVRPRVQHALPQIPGPDS